MEDDIFFMVLDSARFDTFQEAKAPHMKAVGPLEKVHSPACWTTPSIISYMLGIPPLGACRQKRDYLFPGYSKRLAWAPKFYQEQGYFTVWLSPNPVPQHFNIELEGTFRKYFNFYKVDGYPEGSAIPEITKNMAALVLHTRKTPLFLSLLLMETHSPYFNGRSRLWTDPHNPRMNFIYQRMAIEWIDHWFPKLLQPFKNMNRNVHVIITSDHGELLGPTNFGHDPSDEAVDFQEDLFTIPLIRGFEKYGSERP